MCTQLRKVVNESQNNWDEKLDGVLYGYRTRPQSSSKYSPFEVMFGQPPGLPMDVRGVQPDDITWGEPTEEEVGDRMQHLYNRCADIRTEAKGNIEAAQAKQKERYDIKHRGEMYKLGDVVMKYNRRKDTWMGGKLNPTYTGPYVIEEVIGRGCYRLRDGERVMKQTVNAVNLKVYVSQVSPSGSPTSTPTKPTRTMPTPTKRTPTSTPTKPTPTVDTELQLRPG
jgi:hypothetical protein